MDANGRWNWRPSFLLSEGCSGYGCGNRCEGDSDVDGDTNIVSADDSSFAQSSLGPREPSADVPRSKQIIFAHTDFIDAEDQCSTESSQDQCSQEQVSHEDNDDDGTTYRKPRRWSIFSEDRQFFMDNLNGSMEDLEEVDGAEQVQLDELNTLLGFRRVHKGVCWKLIAEHVDTPRVESMAVLMNWRRREFVVKKDGDHVGILYSSEKNNGQLGHSCTLKKANQNDATFEELPCVAMAVPDAAATLDICRSLHSYDLSTCPLKALKSTGLYESSIPDKLYPLRITWCDGRSTKNCQQVFGFVKVETRAIWLRKLNQFVS